MAVPRNRRHIVVTKKPSVEAYSPHVIPFREFVPAPASRPAHGAVSYFIEPNPGRRGWQKRHRYQSHGLRFEVKGPTETLDAFRKSLNQRALEEDEERPSSSADDRWFLGELARKRGSVHSDIWVGMAADLAECGAIGVYPVSGWWKEQPKRDRSEKGARYSLTVSIETAGVEADIWTPVAQEVGVQVEAVDTNI